MASAPHQASDHQGCPQPAHTSNTKVATRKNPPGQLRRPRASRHGTSRQKSRRERQSEPIRTKSEATEPVTGYKKCATKAKVDNNNCCAPSRAAAREARGVALEAYVLNAGLQEGDSVNTASGTCGQPPPCWAAHPSHSCVGVSKLSETPARATPDTASQYSRLMNAPFWRQYPRKTRRDKPEA